MQRTHQSVPRNRFMLRASSLVSIALGLLLVSCGQTETYRDGGSEDSADARPMVSIPVSLAMESDQQRSLGLVDTSVTSFTIDVVTDSCDSGSSDSMTYGVGNTDTTLSLPAPVLGCIAALTSFEIDSKTYTSTGTPSFAQGEVIPFEHTDENGITTTKTIFVLSQIGSAASNEPEAVEFGIDLLHSGASVVINEAPETVNTGVVMGRDIPLQLENTTQINQYIDGRAVMTFELTCMADWTDGSGNVYSEPFDTSFTDGTKTVTCDDDITDDNLSYALVEDTYVDGINPFDIAAAEALSYRDTSVSLHIDETGRLLFQIGGLQTPNPVVQDNNMLLVLKRGQSYQVFSITMAALGNNPGTP